MLKTALSYLHIFIRLHTIPERDGRTDGRTDIQTDRRNPSGYYSALHCVQCGCAAKINPI